MGREREGGEKTPRQRDSARERGNESHMALADVVASNERSDGNIDDMRNNDERPRSSFSLMKYRTGPVSKITRHVRRESGRCLMGVHRPKKREYIIESAHALVDTGNACERSDTF